MRAARRSGSHRSAAVFAWHLLPVIMAPAVVACEAKVRPLAAVHRAQDDRGIASETESLADGGSEALAVDDALVGSLSPAEEEAASGEENSCVNDAGSCAAPATLISDDELGCPGCLIEGECTGADVIDEGNPCLVCDPERDPLGWSPNDGVTCDDQLFCTTDDVCNAGTCSAQPRECDDGVDCNGVSTCDEESDSCSPGITECGMDFVCDLATDTCVTTCSGCLVSGVCLPSGSEAAGNPCLVCNPAVSTTNFSPAIGKACGAGANACSQQDTCDAQGVCQFNHLPAGAPCGTSTSTACNQPDTCDGAGQCLQRLSPNGTQCDDGTFCTVGDECQAGQCISTATRNCGVNRTCNELANQCRCVGCSLDADCIAIGASCGGSQICTADNTCKLGAGASCASASDCASGLCETWFRDADGDGEGNPNSSTRTCAPLSLASSAPEGFTANSADCCDVGGASASEASLVFRRQSEVFGAPQTVCPDVRPFDFNCDGLQTAIATDGTTIAEDTSACGARFDCR